MVNYQYMMSADDVAQELNCSKSHARKWLIVLMAAVAIGATGILGWLYMRQDRKGPEITIAESKKNSLYVICCTRRNTLIIKKSIIFN